MAHLKGMAAAMGGWKPSDAAAPDDEPTTQPLVSLCLGSTWSVCVCSEEKLMMTVSSDTIYSLKWVSRLGLRVEGPEIRFH